MITRFITLCCLFVSIYSQAQIPVGAWRDHLSYNNIIGIEEYNNQIIALTDRALFIHDIESNSNRRITKANGLAGVDMLSIGVDSVSGIILVGYANGVFDIIINGNITNVRDIARSVVIGDLGIYNVFFNNSLAYLSTGFGIVVFDIKDREIKETYFIGQGAKQLRVNDVAIFENDIYAATNEGIYVADVNNANLTDFRNWNRVSTIQNSTERFNNLAVFANKLFVNYWSPENTPQTTYSDLIFHFDGVSWVEWKIMNNIKTKDLRVSNGSLVLSSSNTVSYYNTSLAFQDNVGTLETDPKPKYSRPNGAVLLNNQELWIADSRYGMVHWHVTNGLQKYVLPQGPSSNNVVQLKMYNDNLWAVSGGVTGTWNNTFNRGGFYSFVNESWSNYSPDLTESLDGSYDYISVEIDPVNNDNIWVGTWGQGLFQIQNGEVINKYTADNSPLEIDINRTDADFTKIGGLTYDIDGNLWMTNPQCQAPLKVLTAAGDWYSFEMGNELPTEFPVSEIIITESGYKWIIRPRKKGMFVFDDNGTISNKNDDRWKQINTEVGSGELPTLSVNTARLDLDGEMWLGTAAGIAVFYSPDEVFNDENFKAEQILIEQDGNVQILLESEVITSIEIDGANRKWVGTQASGVYLLSSDGTKQIYHFTTENSPLINNEISDITLNHGNGEVYFATSEGIISFKGTATTGLLENSEPFVYPNPVPPGYEGVIAVKNLVANSYFKVIDIAGNMIYESQTEGGQAIWNGKNYQGDKVETGVYLFLITDDTGKQTSTAKVLVTK
jgi:hypothetical protein